MHCSPSWIESRINSIIRWISEIRTGKDGSDCHVRDIGYCFDRFDYLHIGEHTLKASQDAIDLIKHYEGLQLKAYVCPAGVLTIGYGHTGKDIWKDMVITELAAEQFLKQDLAKFEPEIARYVKVALNQGQYDALCSFVFNLGPRALATSTLLKKINASDFKAVPAEFAKWDKAKVNGEFKALPGLTKRRKSEALLFAGETLHDALIAGKIS